MIVIRRHSTIVLAIFFKLVARAYWRTIGADSYKGIGIFKGIFWLLFCFFSLTKGELFFYL
jgi:hypothetical protein